MSKKITLLGFTLAAAMLLSYIESLIPPLVAIPGVKIGLANIAVIFALYRIGIKESILVSFVRIVLSSLLFSNILSFIYSVAGAALSLLLMTILKKTDKFSYIGISIVGGVTHNVGQIFAAIIIVGSNVIALYLPALIISGTLCGGVIGIIAGVILKRFEGLKIK